LAEATGPGPAEPRGWSVSRVEGTFKMEPRPVSSAPPRVTFEKFVTQTPPSVAAGEMFNVQAAVVDANGRRVEDWKGRVEMRSASPPVRWARVDLPGPAVSMACRFTRAGD